MKTVCHQCKHTFFATNRRGITPKYCSPACKQKAYRKRRPRIPARMTCERRWVRADGKRPVMADGSPASTTNPATWVDFKDVRRGAGDGFGVMLGGGLACFDFDNCLDSDGRVSEMALGVLRRIYPESIVMTERSVSGRGLHVFVEAPESGGVRSPGIEYYSRARFIRVTGDVVDLGALMAS